MNLHICFYQGLFFHFLNICTQVEKKNWPRVTDPSMHLQKSENELNCENKD